MRTLCAILLLGVVTYVQAYHPCAPLAVKVEESTIQGPSSNAPPLSLMNFYYRITGVFYVDEATPHYTPDAKKYCIPARYDANDCGGIRYATKSLDNQFTIDGNLLLGKTFETTSISYRQKSDFSVQYKMTFAGIDPHNYIFKQVDSIAIDAQTLAGHGHAEVKLPLLLTHDIYYALTKEFALFSYQPGPQGYNLFVSCDKTSAWVTYNQQTTPSEAMEQALQRDIMFLANIIPNFYLVKTNKSFTHYLSQYITRVY